MEPRIRILVETLAELGISRQELEVCLQEVSPFPQEERLRRFLALLEQRKMISEEKGQDLRLALQFSEEAAAVFFKAHLQQKPVVLLLKGLEEILKTVNEKPEGRADALRGVVPGPASARQEEMKNQAGSSPTHPSHASPERGATTPPVPFIADERLPAEEGGSEDDPGEKTEPLEAVSPASLWVPPDKASRLKDSHYEVIAPIGLGRLTEVFKAKDRARGQFVVLKFFPPGCGKNRGLVEKLFAGARQAMRLEHPGLSPIRQIVLADAECYAVSEFVEGATLKSLLASGSPLAPRRALLLFEQILEGVKAAHDSGLCHGSLHPGNIMMKPTGSVCVLDFGFGLVAETEPGLDPPEGPRIYRAHYLAPERHGQPTAPTPASDTYELGIVLYHMLTGHPPFPAQDMETLGRKHGCDTLPALPPFLNFLADSLVPLLERMTAKDPKARPQSLETLLEEIRNLKELASKTPAPSREEPSGQEAEPAPADQPGDPDEAQKPVRRARRGRLPTPGGPVQTFVTFLVVLVVLSVVFILSQRNPLGKQPKDLVVLANNLAVRGERDEDVARQLVAQGDRAIPVLRSLLDNGLPAQHVPAVHTLAELSTPAAESEMLRLLDHRNPEVIGEVLVFLGKMRRPGALEYLARAAKDPESTVRRKAMMGLGYHGGKDALHLVQTHGLKDEDIAVRKQAEIAQQSLLMESENPGDRKVSETAISPGS